jgi:pimeloyl-ACP methyl ester carboxylesterase
MNLIFVILLIALILVAFVAVKLLHARKMISGGNHLPTVVFIPGLGNGKESFNWDTVDEELATKMNIPRNSGIEKPISSITKTISFDPPGINNESPVPNTIEEYCKFVHELVGDDIIIVAHSIGCVLANKYSEMYPVIGMLFLDPTPDFILDDMAKPDFYKKSGGKYDIVRKYINLFAGQKQRPNQNARVIYNTEDEDGRKELQSKYITENYKNILNVHNKTHFIHLTDPDLVIDEIKELLIKS